MDCWPVFVELAKDFPKAFSGSVDPKKLLEKYNSFFVRNNLHSKFYLIEGGSKVPWSMVMQTGEFMHCALNEADRNKFYGENGIRLIATFCDPLAEHRKDIEKEMILRVQPYIIDLPFINALFFDQGIACYVTHSLKNPKNYYFLLNGKQISQISRS